MKHSVRLILTAITNPLLVVVFLLRKLPLSWFFELRMHVDGIDRPYYAYGLYQAALEAKSLGIGRISAFEFGVAAGTGLVLLEKLASQITKLTGIEIDVYGFDMEIGLPESSTYKDVPYIWQKGFYKMDVKKLRSNLKSSTQLVLGNVKKTVPKFIKKSIAPIGFIAFDLDYYTSTRDAFKLFDISNASMLPRIYCYFDDIVGTDEEVLCEYVGELLAIQEFNQKHKNQKIAKINGLFHKRVIKSTWSDMIYVLHNFAHKKYNTYIYPLKDRQIPL
jgi:hypothetical protein